MRKKSFLISGVVLAAASLASYAVLSAPKFVNAIADEDEPTPELTDVKDWTDWTSTIPAADAKVPSTEPISMIQLVYPTNGDDGLTVQRTEDLNIEIKKDGTTLYTIPVSNKDMVKGDSKYYNYADIILPEAISEPGTYEVIVPKDAFLVKEADAQSYTHSDGTTYTNAHVLTYNNAQSFTFTVVKNYSYTVSPEPGTDALITELAKIKLTYEEGVDIKILNESSNIVLNWWQSGKDTAKTTYKASAEGNVVTLTAVDPTKITAQAKGSAKWYHVNIPADVWSVNGTTNTETNLTPYGAVTFKATDIQCSIEGGATVTADEAFRIALTFPNPVTVANTSSMATLSVKSGTNTLTATYNMASQSANGKTIVFEPTVQLQIDRQKLLLSGDATFSLAASKVADEFGNKNGALTFPSFKFIGADYVGLNPSSSTTPKDGTVLTATNYAYFSLPFFTYVLPSSDESMVATLKLNGETIKSWKASEVSTKAASQAGFASYGSSSVYFILDEALNSSSAYGKYVLNVPAGMFTYADDTNIKSQEINIEVINRNPAASPQMSIAEGGPAFWNDAKEFPNINGFNTFTVEYPEGCTVTSKNMPASLQAYYGRTSKLVAANSTFLVYTTIKNIKVACEGNKAIFTFDPCPAINEFSNYYFTIPANVLTVTDTDGEEYGNAATNLYFRVENPVKGSLQLVEGSASSYTMKPFPTTLTANNIDDLATFYYLSNDALKSISDATALPYLENAETGEQVAGVTFTKTKDTDVNLTGVSGKLEIFTCKGIEKIGIGKYNFVIPANCLSYGGDALATADNDEFGFVNTEVYKFPIEVELGDIEEEFTPSVTSKTTGVTAEINVDATWNEINVTLVSEDATVKEAVLELPMPAGYNAAYAMNIDAMGGDTEPYYVRRVDSEGWPTEAEVLSQGMQKVTTITIPADKKVYEYGLLYGTLGLVNPNRWMLNASFDNTVGVNGILVEGEEAAYFTLQGVRVLNPGEGIFVKVANGKATKVIRK